jgi:hypothetical protein
MTPAHAHIDIAQGEVSEFATERPGTESCTRKDDEREADREHLRRFAVAVAVACTQRSNAAHESRPRHAAQQSL